MQVQGYTRLVRREVATLAGTEAIVRALQEQGISRTELARRLGWTCSRVVGYLSGRKDLSLKALADMADALGLEVQIELKEGGDYT